MKLKELEPILLAQTVNISSYDGEFYAFNLNANNIYFDDDNNELFEKYGEYEIVLLYDGDYDSISIDLE